MQDDYASYGEPGVSPHAQTPGLPHFRVVEPRPDTGAGRFRHPASPDILPRQHRLLGRRDAVERWRRFLCDGLVVASTPCESGRCLSLRRALPGEIPAGLTAIERRIARLASHAHSDKEIAYLLGLALGTVSSLVHRSLRKLGLQNRLELVRLFGDIRGTAPESALDPHLQLPKRAAVYAHDPAMIQVELPAPAPCLPRCLTPAEQEVARAAYVGLTSREIAWRRGTSPKTIGNQLEAIFRKLRVASRAELVLRLGGDSCGGR